MTAAGLVATQLSHLGIGLNGRGDFRGPVRFAGSTKPWRPVRCDRDEPVISNVLCWVGECGESCPLISPALSGRSAIHPGSEPRTSRAPTQDHRIPTQSMSPTSRSAMPSGTMPE
jgi:hypothetical protein